MTEKKISPIVHVPDENIVIEWDANHMCLLLTQDGADTFHIDAHNVPPLQMALEYAQGYASLQIDMADDFDPIPYELDTPATDAEFQAVKQPKGHISKILGIPTNPENTRES